MVLTQLSDDDRLHGIFFTFPYHYGSYATSDDDDDIVSVFWKFPYHYGSYATEKQMLDLFDGTVVSIPLWFLRNKKLATRFKLYYYKFPYHYGSYATCRMKKIF